MRQRAATRRVVVLAGRKFASVRDFILVVEEGVGTGIVFDGSSLSR